MNTYLLNKRGHRTLIQILQFGNHNKCIPKSTTTIKVNNEDNKEKELIKNPNQELEGEKKGTLLETNFLMTIFLPQNLKLVVKSC